jgi:predicted amidohydrolase YtcJ
VRRFPVLIALLLSAAAIATAQTTAPKKAVPVTAKVPPADVIFTNGDIYTGGHTSTKGNYFSVSDGSRATAIAVRAGKIAAVWKQGAEPPQGIQGPNTKVIDLGGKFVMPGFNDAHAHLASGGSAKLQIELLGTKSLEEMKQRIAAAAKKAAPGEWLIGRGWDHTTWTVVKLPSRQDLDAVTGDHPAYFDRVDGHISVANTAALKAAGIGKASADVAGGKADRDANGEPTGILREKEKGLVESKIPPPSAEQRRKGVELALAEAVSWGLTSAQDNSPWEAFLVYEQLQKEDKLPLRITEWLPFDAPVARLTERRAHHPLSDPMLHTGMLKGFMDGSLGSRTAAMLEPYADDQGNTGLPQYDQPKLNLMAAERVAAGFQLGFHAIGDRGVRMAIDAFEYAKQKNASNHKMPAGAQGPDDLRFRVEHAQVVAPEDISRFASVGVIPSMQANHLLTDMNWAESRIGPTRARTSYAWKDLFRATDHLAFGTDFPVEPITPFRGLYAAVTRKNEAGDKGYPGDQALNIHQAIYAYTLGSAYAEFAETNKGSIAPGYYADFVVLDRDITKVAPAEILKTRVLRTVVGGKTVYEKK